MTTITIFPDNQPFCSNPSRRERLLSRFFTWLLHRKIWTTRGTAGNRYYGNSVFGHLGVSLAIKDLREPSGYTREELYRMLLMIRREERRHQWKVPEPPDFGNYTYADTQLPTIAEFKGKL